MKERKHNMKKVKVIAKFKLKSMPKYSVIDIKLMNYSECLLNASNKKKKKGA